MTTLIIGGTTGIGRALASALLSEGSPVVVASRNPRPVPGARVISADVTSADSVRCLFEEIGSVDHIVTTAVRVDGAYVPVASVTPDDVDRAFGPKLLGPLLLARYAPPGLRSLVVTGGFNARRPAPGGSVIAAANGAVEALVRALAIELAPVRVNCLSPGWVDTDIWDSLAGPARRERLDAMGARLPVGKVATASDLTSAYLTLMRNPHITGTTLFADGGQRLV